MYRQITLKQRLYVLVIFSLCLSCQAIPMFAADEPKPETQEEVDRWMALKLASAQQIFSDLTHGDMKALQANARRMQVMHILEQWSLDKGYINKSRYQGQLNAFDFATKEMIRHAGDENVEGALESYVAMTQSCVRCHQLIREKDEK